jgi:propionyl-CoA synthetase
MEEVIASHPDVAECAVLGTADQLKGEVPLGMFVLKAGVTRDPAEISKELVQMVRDRIGAVACFKEVTKVVRLPKTRSGKILRGTMRSIANGKEFRVPSTIDDPVIIDEITETLKDMGFPKA